MSVDRVAPRAEILLDAVAGNAWSWRGADAVADLRADACGHGAEACAEALARIGIRYAVADQADRTAVAAAGLTLVDTDPTVVPEALFGLTGVGAAAMRFVGTVLGVKALLAGEGVSYGYRHRAPADTRVALVSGGYAQGVVRSLGGHADISVGGARHPIVGRVAMDVCVVDIGDAEVALGDDAVFFGDREDGEPTIAQWADASSMRPTELVTAVGLRVRRVLLP